MMRVLLMLVSCLAVLTLASPLPRPQEENPRLFINDPLTQGLLNNILGINNVPANGVVIPIFTKTIPCGENQECIITVGR